LFNRRERPCPAVDALLFYRIAGIEPTTATPPFRPPPGVARRVGDGAVDPALRDGRRKRPDKFIKARHSLLAYSYSTGL
jgi:hypothetical protein